MILNQGITINGKNSYSDFGLVISDKTIALPTKKVITDTVPYFNGFYDFSNVQGFNFFDDRYLEYVFDITADTQTELETLYTDVLIWLMDTNQSTIYDTESQKTYIGSLDKWNVEEDILYKQLTVSFKCQPYSLLATQTIHVTSLATSYLPIMQIPTPIKFVNGNDRSNVTLVIYLDSNVPHTNRYVETYTLEANQTIEEVTRESGDIVLNKYGGYINVDPVNDELTMPTMDVYYNERSV